MSIRRASYTIINGHAIIDEATTKDYYEKRGEVRMDYMLISGNLRGMNNSKIDNFSGYLCNMHRNQLG